MMEIENWMKQYCGAVRAAFGDRVRYIGLQGSRGRGEAGPDSDIDVVCILDSCSLQDLETYRAAVKDLPDRDKLCGFVSGTAELAAWDRDGSWYGRSEALGEGVYCVTPEGTAFRVSEDMGRFSSRLLAGEEVREMWEPAPGLRVYPSKAEAAGQIRLIPLSELAPEALERGE